MTPELKHLLLAAACLLTLAGCSAEYHATKGRDALDAHELAQAESHYRKALDKDPKQPEALAGLGWTYQISGRRDGARGAFQKCLELLPDEVSCLRGMASVVMADGNPANAQELLAKALKLAPEDPGVQGSQAILEMTLGELDQAAARYATLVQRYPSMAEYRLGYAEVLLRQKKAEEALAMADQGLALEQTPPRFVAMLNILRARALVAATSGRVNPRDCASTAPPVLAWLDAADGALVSAKAAGVGVDITQVQRLIARRRGAVEDRCPGVTSGDAAEALPALGKEQTANLVPPPVKKEGEAPAEGTGAEGTGAEGTGEGTANEAKDAAEAAAPVIPATP